MEVHLPPLLIQRKIATILSAYDDLIENNTRRIEILEEMARSLYREWFVNFRFPGHEQVKMVDSELGLIPEGWKVVPLEKLTHPKKPIQYGVLKPGESDDNGVLLIRGGDILNGTIATYQLRTITKEVSNKYKRTLLEGGELIVSLVGNPGEVAVVPEKLKGANIARQAGRVVLQKELYTPYVMRFLMSDKGRGELFASTTGSVQKVINIIALKQVRILLPQDSVLHKAVPIFNSIYQYQEILREKIQNFRQTRDLLLPKLISGEIDVENLDIALEEIAA
jgi:type I restriction enzyme, S subunit